MLKGFRDFIMRGNVVELAIAVVIGTAFTALVSSFTKSIIQPIIAAIGGSNVNGLAVQLNSSNPQSVIDFGAVINAVITFLITASVVYFIFVVPMNKINEIRARKAGIKDTDVPLTDLELLTEIRDLLRAQQSAGVTQPLPPNTTL